MRSLRSLFIVIAVTLISSLSGCAAFRSGETQAPAPWPAAKGTDKPSISLLVSGEGLLNGDRKDIPQQIIVMWQQAAEKAYKDSGLFSDVQVGAADTDLRAEIHVIDRGEGSTALAMLSGFTLTLVPSHSKDEMVMTTTLKNREGRGLGTYEKKETLSMWIQFFLIFIMPFNWPGSVAHDIAYDLNRATINEAYSTGGLQALELVPSRV